MSNMLFLTFHSVIPNIVFPPQNFHFVYETNQFMEIVFQCHATGIPAPTIQFFLGDTLLDDQYSERFSLPEPIIRTTDISISGDVVFLVLQNLSISSVLDSDSNNYSCVAMNENVRQPNDSVEFELIVRGKC